MRETLYSIALIGALALTGCQRTERIIDGRVYDKVHEPATTETVITPINIKNNFYGREEKEIPETFVLRIEKQVDRERKTRNVFVDHDTFNKYQIGDNYPDTETRKN